MTSIEFVEKLSDELIKKMEDGLHEYENKHGIDVNFKDRDVEFQGP